MRADLLLFLALGACSPREWKAADETSLGVALTATACDLGGTRRAAMSDWRTEREENPVIGQRPSASTVDGYFGAVVATEAMAWLVTPPRYRTLVLGLFGAIEIDSLEFNAPTTGLCGL